MEQAGNGAPRRPNPRRRRRRKIRKMIEAYLPLAIAALIIILIIAFIAGSISRSNARREQEKQASLAAEQSSVELRMSQEAEAASLIAQAEVLAAGCDYDGAIAVLDSFSGNLYDFDELLERRDAYESAKETLVAWEDPSKIVNLSFHNLVADPQRAFRDEESGESHKYHYVTTGEFSAILEQLYENNYILVDLDDIITAQVNSDGSVSYKAATLYLPTGKTPVMLTQTQVNYYTYLIDSDDDQLPDKGGDGFASRLIVDASGNLTCEMVDASGATVTGAYDLVPILEDFIAQHPDFSYRGARALLTVSGYDGLFGYRVTDPENPQYAQHRSELPAVLQALEDMGYLIGSYTYGNIAYGTAKDERFQSDLDAWVQNVVPLLSDTRILVFAKNSDISDNTAAYGGERYAKLYNAGFRYFVGFGNTPWLTISTDHVRIGRLMVTGNALQNSAQRFEGLFRADDLLDNRR